jgi:peptide/nickel transport system ATP-binding protein
MSKYEQLLAVNGITKEFHIGGVFSGTTFMAVNAAHFELIADTPEIFTLAGESGSGKTTLARLILHDLEPTSGSIVYKGDDVTSIKSRKGRMQFMEHVQPIFQNPFEAFNPLKRVDTYLYATALNFGLAKNKKIAAGMVDEVLKSVGLSLEEVQGRYPHELSGGQLQRVAVARALISKPSLLIADEPVSMVDASLRMSIVNLFKDLKDEYGVSVIYITHDLATAYYISDRIAIMLRGNIVEMGPVEKVLTTPLHPYTKILKESIPEPTPRERWTEKIEFASYEVKEFARIGCKFAGRCPSVMERCRQADPQDVVVDERTVKCYLYADSKTGGA